jgi:uridine kinase
MRNPNERIARPKIVGVAGGSGAGKTTVVDRIVERLGSDRVTCIQHDRYYIDRGDLLPRDRALVNYDHPDALETPLLVEHLKKLVSGSPVEIPVYDFASHERTNETTTAEPREVIFLEGILILSDTTLRDLMDIKIFVDTDADLRLMRRVERDIANRGRTLDAVVRQYLRTVRPMHLEFVEPSKRYADVIIPEGGYNEVAVDMLYTKIASILKNPEPDTPSD